MRKGFGVDRLGGPISIDKDQVGGSEGSLEMSYKIGPDSGTGVGAWTEHPPQSSRQRLLKVKKINLFSL